MSDTKCPKCGCYRQHGSLHDETKSSFSASSGSPPTWADCEKTFWSMEAAMRSGNIAEFRNLNARYNEQLSAWEKAVDTTLAKAENADIRQAGPDVTK